MPSRFPVVSLRQLLWMAAATLLFVPLALIGVALDDVWRILQNSDWRPVALATALCMFTLAAKAARWRVLFEQPATFVSLFAALVIGQAGNLLLPARLGDLMRVYVLGRREGRPAALTIGTIVAEKLVELGVLMGLTVLVAPFVPLPAGLWEPSARLGVLAVAGLALCGFLFFQQSRLRRVWGWAGAKILRAEPALSAQQFDLTVAGLAPLLRWPHNGRLVAWSALIWALMIATNYALFFALPIAPSWLMAVVLLVVLQVGVAVPSTPGKVGVIQALVVLTLSLFAIDRAVAFSYGLILYVVVVAPQILAAAPFIWQEVLSLRRPEAMPRTSE